MRFILRFFSKKSLWAEILRREEPEFPKREVMASIWLEVFRRVPELKDYLKRREISLLKSTTLRDKSTDIILGQILENRLWQNFDTVVPEVTKGRKIVAKELPTLSDFLGKWKGDAHKKQENVAEGGVQRAEEEPAPHSG